MKKHFLFLTLFFLSINATAQFVTIPDTNFRNWLNANGFSTCMVGDFMDTTCAAILNTDTINTGLAGINNLDGIQYFDNLVYLTCVNHQSTPVSKRFNTITAFPNSLRHIYIAWHNITSLPAFPDSLEKFECGYGTLQQLPSLPPTLFNLACWDNEIDTIPALPPLINYINCFGNNLTYLPPLPSSLRDLRCGYNPLLFLPTLPDSLETLLCEWIPNLAVPVMPNGLKALNCSKNEWTNLPSPLPDSLISLTCAKNQFSDLPPLPLGLKYLNFSINPITSFPILPPDLYSLSCDSINLTAFPTNLPPGLNTFTCSNNPLTSLPDFPPLLEKLLCNNTFLTEIPDLNDDMDWVEIKNNPNLICFPKYQSIDYLYWINSPITCLPNAGFIGTATPAINNLPICLSVSPCEFNWSMYGRIYNDTNNNCSVDTTELLFQNLRVNLKSGGSILQSFIFNTEGYYSFKTGFGFYQIEIDTTGLPFNITCPGAGLYNSAISAADSTDEDLDFGLKCKPGYFDLKVLSISPNQFLRPGSQVKLNLKAGDAALFYGVTCSAGMSGMVQATLSGPVTYISPAMGALTPTSVTPGTITWNIADFSQVNPYKDFNIMIEVDTMATIFDTICVQLSISPTTDSNPLNNSAVACYPVHSSFDPNAKSVYPSGDIDTTQQWLNYTIYFQNTGTFPAQHIYLLDTIDNDLDKNSFEFLSSSHDPITQLLPGNILRFSFPDIDLPDSTSDEPGSHGFVQYRIKTKPGLIPGTTISNTAHIYFDYNVPVATNTVHNVVTLPTGISSSADPVSFQLFPNPANNQFTIVLSNTHPIPLTYSLIDLTGKIIRKEMLNNVNQLTVSVSDLSEGIYFVKIEGEGIMEVERVAVIKNK